MVLRPATRGDLARFYGCVPASMKAIVAEHEGVIVGVAGLRYCGDKLLAFSELRESMRSHKKAILRAGRMLCRLMQDAKAPIYAVASKNEKNAAGFLRHLGFEFAMDSEDGEVYRWVN